MKVADCHCDLLSYLIEEEGRDVKDEESQASFPQLQEGGVGIQIFPIYTSTASDSVIKGNLQLEMYTNLKLKIESFFHSTLTPYLAIENSSSVCCEDEPLQQGLDRLEMWHQKHPLIYISLTWNGANRFGGGAHTQLGLTQEGGQLLEWMISHNIAIDLSHASDQLAFDILKEVKGTCASVIASHSNFRSVQGDMRNLPDKIALGIYEQQGVIGLNLVRHFLGEQGISDLVLHIEHAKRLGIENALCLGADFFAEVDVAPKRSHLKPFFFKSFHTSACYPRLTELLHLSFDSHFIQQIMYNRLALFLDSLSRKL
ncbi:MAG: membrane dipeptidase [Candidatus Rhabdochlamydia sp.]